MTALSPILARPRPAKAALPTDIDELREIAERLQGRPVPGVRLTERQFVDWRPDGVRAEWENGEVVLITSPNGKHVDLNLWLARLFVEFAEHHDLGLVRIPFTVRLAEQKRHREPDLQFIAKRRMSIVRPNHLEGPPDLAVEIVSPDSTVRDWRTKFAEYERAGVIEYWVVDPLIERFDLYTLRAKKYQQRRPDEVGRIRSAVLRGLSIKPEWLWQTPLPKLTTVLKELGLR